MEALTSNTLQGQDLRAQLSDPDETQEAEAPLELQSPPSVTPSKYDLANRRIGLVLDDKWRLDRLLGVGGMAAVYAATHRNGARAAIKLLPFSVATGPEICQRLLREGYLANRIKHPAVTRVLDDQIDYDKEHAYIVMELLSGETARERVERSGPLEPPEAVAMMLALADCLSAAHAANVIHRDIKPENIFITESGVKVLDFGIARALDGNSNLTQTGTSLGTPAYMSPEQARGKHEEISPQSDIYSLGATLLFLISGQTIHEGENALELMVRAAWTPAPPALEICPQISPDLAAVIDRCCAFEPKERYPSAEAVIRALSSLRDLPKQALSRPPVGQKRRRAGLSPAEVLRSLPAAAETLRGSAPPRRWSASRSWTVALGASLALGAGGLWLLGGADAEEEASVSRSAVVPTATTTPQTINSELAGDALEGSTSASIRVPSERLEPVADNDSAKGAVGTSPLRTSKVVAPRPATTSPQQADQEQNDGPPTASSSQTSTPPPKTATNRPPRKSATSKPPPRTVSTFPAQAPSEKSQTPSSSVDGPNAPKIDYRRFRERPQD